MNAGRVSLRLATRQFRVRPQLIAVSSISHHAKLSNSLLTNQQSPLITPIASNARNFSTEARDIQKEIADLVVKNKVVVFMKGVPSAPRCGFSNAVVQIMRMHDVTYEAHDVLSDEELRQGIKDYSNWPTIPQVYMEGEFIGGCDILLQMHQSGELVEELTKIGIKSALLEPEEK